MNRITRAAVATAMAAAVALGASAPAAVAGPPEHAKGAHAEASKGAKAEKAGKAATAKGDKVRGPKMAKADRKVARLQRKLGRQITRKEAFLARVENSDKLAKLGETYASLVGANIATDVTHLDELSTRVSDDAATFEAVRELSAEVGAVRPQVYNRIISQIRRATAMQASAVEVPEAQALLAGALDSLSTITAITSRSALRDVHSLLAQAAALLEAVEAPEDSEVPETGTDEPGPVDNDAPASEVTDTDPAV